MNAKLYDIVFERLAESQLSGNESNRVLSACQGEEALRSWLVDGVALHLEGRLGQLETGPGAYSQERPTGCVPGLKAAGPVGFHHQPPGRLDLGPGIEFSRLRDRGC